MRGKVFGKHHCNVTIRDHPRLCGEKFYSHLAISIYLGSPPPMRGKEESKWVWISVQRITPAYAGKRYCAIYPDSSRKDHPRLCGEKVQVYYQALFLMGSPPPMRGKASLLLFILDKFRITPAYAGKRQCCNHNIISCEDHPRLCGEKAGGLQSLGS